MELQNQLRSYLQSYETYSNTREIKLRVLYGDKNHIKLVQQCLSKFIIDNDESPILRLLALKFNKELAETFNEEYIHLMQKIVLPKLESIALFEKESKDSDRGKLFFLNNTKPNQGNKELQSIGDQFLRVTLECIRIWGRWFPLDKQHHRLSYYRVAYERLFNLGVHFTEIQYFDIQQVHQNLPSTFPPLSMMFQLKSVLSERSNGSTKEICRFLESHLPEEYHQTQYQSYAELFQSVVKKHILNKRKQMKIASLLMEQEQLKYNEIKQMEQKEENTQIQRLEIEIQQLSYLNNMHQLKVLELQKQIIEMQNQKIIILQQLQGKEQLLDQMRNQFETLDNQFKKLIQDYQTLNHSKSVYIEAQFQKNLAEYRIEYGISYNEIELNKIQKENEYLNRQLEEIESMYETLKHDKDVIITENKLLSAKVSQLTQKIIKGTKIEKNNFNTEEMKLYRQKSHLVQYEQVMIQQKAQIYQLKDQLIKMNDKKQSVTSQSYYLSTKAGSKRNIEEQQIIQQSLLNSNNQLKTITNHRQSKIIMPPSIEYDGNIFAINPNNFTTRFRQACLTKRSILYSDAIFQVLSTSIIKNNNLIITLTIENKSQQIINGLQLKLQDNQNINVQMIGEIQNHLQPNQLYSIDIEIVIKEIPYLLQEIQLISNIHTITFALPCTINKFFTYKNCTQIPSSYFYQSKQFQTGFQNAITNLLQDYEIIIQQENEICLLSTINFKYVEYQIMISSKKSLMQIKINGPYDDKLVTTIISTYQGLFLKR